MFVKRVCALLLAMLCLSLGACTQKAPQQPAVTEPTKGGNPILPGFTEQTPSPNDYTAVYVTVFEDLAIIASYPVLEYQGKEPECSPRELSTGCGILCGGEHENEIPISHVMITGQLVPKSMNGWFRDMVHLTQIDGLELIRTHNVKDMSYLFAGCEKISELEIDGWDVSNVTDMTGIFEGCSAMVRLPEWYALEDTGSFS